MGQPLAHAISCLNTLFIVYCHDVMSFQALNVSICYIYSVYFSPRLYKAHAICFTHALPLLFKKEDIDTDTTKRIIMRYRY